MTRLIKVSALKVIFRLVVFIKLAPIKELYSTPISFRNSVTPT